MSSSQSKLFKDSQFRNYEFRKLCFMLGFSRSQLSKLLDSIANNYTEWSKIKKDKNGNVKTYFDGTVKTRTFRNPSVLLKEIQRRIKKNILDKVQFPQCVHGGVKGGSNVTNAKAHQGNKYIFETDLQEFYPGITAKKVYQVFIDLGYSCHISHWLTILTTKENELPQGAPTSTGIANLAFLKTDLKLIELCSRNDIKYTRYVDDLTFSSQADFSHLITNIIGFVIDDGFKINRRKTNYEGGQAVTGIDVFLNKIDAPAHILEKSRIELEMDSEKKPYSLYVRHVRSKNKRANPRK